MLELSARIWRIIEAFMLQSSLLERPASCCQEIFISRVTELGNKREEE